MEDLKGKVVLRLAEEKDYSRILAILNDAIRERRVTALLTPVTLDSRSEWFKDHTDGIHPIYVAEHCGEIVGWMAVNAYRSGREGFRFASEISYYIDSNYQNKGVGSCLMRHVIIESRKRGLKFLMAVIFADNLASQKLAKKHGFDYWGRFPEIVDIDGRVTDCYQMGLKL